jgi:hypothetical protein
MHLGLIDGPFVPHNLISTKERPVPLLKFQMAARLKIVTASRSKKGTQIYFSFLSQVTANEPLPGSPTGPLWRERDPPTGHLGSPVKEPSLKVPSWNPSQRDAPTLEPSPVYDHPPHTRFPLNGKGPPWRRPHLETFLTYLPGSPTKGPPKPPPRSLFRERCTIPRAPSIQFSKSPVDEPSSRFPEQGPYGNSYLQSLFYLSFRVPSKEALHQVPFTELSQRERDTPPPEPLSTTSQSPQYMSPLQVARLSPHEERCPSPG